jgi:LPXTG-motif cell wall-anchored protein
MPRSFIIKENKKGENMKKLFILSAVFGMALVGAASAADVTIYYSPTCPHCHNAREFMGGKVAYEYPSVKLEGVNVMGEENLPAFQAALEKCKYESSGVPVITIGDACFQGYAPMMDDDLRKAVEDGLSDSEKNDAAEIRKSMDADAESFRAAHTDRANAIVERGDQVKKKAESGSSAYFYALLAVLVLGLGFVLIRKNKKK